MVHNIICTDISYISISIYELFKKEQTNNPKLTMFQSRRTSAWTCGLVAQGIEVHAERDSGGSVGMIDLCSRCTDKQPLFTNRTCQNILPRTYGNKTRDHREESKNKRTRREKHIEILPYSVGVGSFNRASAINTEISVPKETLYSHRVIRVSGMIGWMSLPLRSSPLPFCDQFYMSKPNSSPSQV